MTTRYPIIPSGRGLFDWSAADPDPLLARTGQSLRFERNYLAWRPSASGLLTSLGREQPVLVSESPRRLRVEPARANLCQRSSAIGDASWIKEQMTATSAAAVGPDGLMTASTVRETTGGVTNHGFYRNLTGITATQPQALAIWLRPRGRRHVRLAFYRDGSNYARVMLDLQAGTIVLGAAVGTPTIVSYRMRQVGAWWGVEFVAATTASDTTGAFTVSLGSAVSTYSYVGDTALGVDVWGASHEANALCCTSPILTAGSNVQRVADLLTAPFTPPPQPMTVYHAYVDDGAALGVGNILFGVGRRTGSGDPSLFLWHGGGAAGVLTLTHSNGVGTTSSSMTVPGGIARGDLIEAVCTVSDTGVPVVAGRKNGGAWVQGNPGGVLPFPAAWQVDDDANVLQFRQGGGSTIAGGCELVRTMILPGVVARDEIAALAAV